MNIPAPFRLPLPTPPLPPCIPAPPSPSLTLPPLPPLATPRPQVTNMSSDESEMESSEEVTCLELVKLFHFSSLDEILSSIGAQKSALTNTKGISK